MANYDSLFIRLIRTPKIMTDPDTQSWSFPVDPSVASRANDGSALASQHRTLAVRSRPAKCEEQWPWNKCRELRHGLMKTGKARESKLFNFHIYWPPKPHIFINLQDVIWSRPLLQMFEIFGGTKLVDQFLWVAFSIIWTRSGETCGSSKKSQQLSACDADKKSVKVQLDVHRPRPTHWDSHPLDVALSWKIWTKPHEKPHVLNQFNISGIHSVFHVCFCLSELS